MLTGSFITAAGFVPIGFARSSAGEYTFSIFVVVGLALIVSWFVAVVFAPLLGVVILQDAEARQRPSPARSCASSAAFLSAAMRARWLTIGVTLALLRRCAARRAASCRASSSRRRTGPNFWSISDCRRMPRSTPARRRPRGSTSS